MRLSRDPSHWSAATWSSPYLKAATEFDSARDAGSECHSSTVQLVKKYCSSLVEACGKWNLCLCLARVRELGLVRPRVSAKMSTWPCIILKSKVRRRSQCLSARFLQPSWCRMLVTLHVRPSLEVVNLAALRWTFSSAVMSLMRKGSHLLAKYSRTEQPMLFSYLSEDSP